MRNKSDMGVNVWCYLELRAVSTRGIVLEARDSERRRETHEKARDG